MGDEGLEPPTSRM